MLTGLRSYPSYLHLVTDRPRIFTGVLLGILAQTLGVMNNLLPNGLNYHQLNYMLSQVANGFHQQQQQQQQQHNVQPYLGLSPSVRLLPQALLQAQAQSFKGIPLATLLALQQQQQQQQQQPYLQNFTSLNSDTYHKSAAQASSSPPVSVRNTPSPSSEGEGQDIRDSIKEEIMKQLHKTTSFETPKSIQSTNNQETPVNGIKVMEASARGVKRQLDVGQSPQKKKSRPTDKEVEKNNVSGSSSRQQQVPGAVDPRDRLSSSIFQFYKDKQQPEEMFSKKMKLREALFSILKGVFPYCGLYVTGSSMNGFGSRSSDMDLCLMISHNEINQKTEATEILRIIMRAFRKCTFLYKVQLINAKVPILKFSDRISCVECDLNINNSVGIRNTHLLNAYSKLDWRIQPLVVMIKYWAKTQNINDASKMTISSFSIALMVIHYLQAGCEPCVIPSLQQMYPKKFMTQVDIRSLNLNESLPVYQSENNESLGDLFVGFLHYFTFVFNFDEDAMSVRLGSRIPRRVVSTQNPYRNPPSQWKCLCIEEPFDLSNTARSVYDANTFKRIKRVFKVSYQELNKTRELSSILSRPF